MVELHLLHALCLNLVYSVGPREHLPSPSPCRSVDSMALVWATPSRLRVGYLLPYYGGNCVPYLKGGADTYYDNYNQCYRGKRT